MYTQEQNKIYKILYENSEPSVKAVYDYLLRLGWNARLLATPKLVDGIYRDEGDIIIEVNSEWGRVEVKQNLGYDYRSFDGYHTNKIFIDTHNHTHVKVYPYPLCAYALVNTSITGMFWIPSSYKPHWYMVPHVWNTVMEHFQDTSAMDRYLLYNLYFDLKKDALPKELVNICQP